MRAMRDDRAAPVEARHRCAECVSPMKKRVSRNEMVTIGWRRGPRIDACSRRVIRARRASIEIVIRAPMTANWARRLTPITIGESRISIFYVLQCILVRPIFAMRTFVVRSRHYSPIPSSISQSTAFALHDLSRRQRTMVPLTSRKGRCRTTRCRARMQLQSGEMVGAPVPARTGWFSRLRGCDVTPATTKHRTHGGSAGRRRMHSHIVSTYDASRGMFTRFDCMGPDRPVHPRLRSHRLRAASDGTAPAAPPGDRPGVSLHKWS